MEDSEKSFAPFHSLLDGPFIFSNSRPVFYDFKILWALMYHYRNQQRSSFHFHRLNLLMKRAKRFRHLELEYIDKQDKSQLDELLEIAADIKNSSLIAGAAIEKLISMKLYQPFALTAQAAIASIYAKIDFLSKELKLTKNANQSKPEELKPYVQVKRAKIEKPAQKTKASKRNKPEKLSKLSSMRKPMEETDEIDDIFG